MIANAKVAEEYAEYAKAASNLGTTFEDIIHNDFEAYRSTLIKEKVYDEICKEVTMTENEVELENQRQANLEKWDAFTNSIVEEYLVSNEYKETRRELSRCKSLAEENVSQISQIKAAEEHLQIQ